MSSRPAIRPSAPDGNLPAGERRPGALDEKTYGEIDVVLLYIEDARARAERAAAALRAGGAEDFLVEALQRVQDELSEAARTLTQRTFFAVPKAQLTL